MALYLVTGGAGFIGSHIVDALVARGDRVRVLDNFSTGKRENLRDAAGRFELFEGSVTHLDTVREAVDGVDYVFHEAALPSVPRSVCDPIACNDVNVSGTLNVLVAARDVGVKRVVYASSSSVYGNSPVLPKREDMPTNPLSPYAVSKLAGENYCKAFWNVYGLETVSLRYFNVFGPRQDPNSQYAAVIPKFIEMMKRGQRPTIYGDGAQSRDFTYVENVVQANLKACGAPDATVGVFNVARGEQHTLLELVEMFNEILGTKLDPEFLPERAGDVKHSLADVSAAEKVLGYDHGVPFASGLLRTVSSYAPLAQRG